MVRGLNWTRRRPFHHGTSSTSGISPTAMSPGWPGSQGWGRKRAGCHCPCPPDEPRVPHSNPGLIAAPSPPGLCRPFPPPALPSLPFVCLETLLSCKALLKHHLLWGALPALLAESIALAGAPGWPWHSFLSPCCHGLFSAP